MTNIYFGGGGDEVVHGEAEEHDDLEDNNLVR